MDREPELKIIRRAFAKQVTAACGVGDPRVEAAFAAVPADVIYVNAGATRPADVWLDRLKEGGRLILPLTADGFPNRDA
jgi:protein-L-isoaspartate O-methyltransferase